MRARAPPPTPPPARREEICTKSSSPRSFCQWLTFGPPDESIFTILGDPVQQPLGLIALVPGREASTEMNGHNKYIAAVVAFLSAATVGATGAPVAARSALAPAASHSNAPETDVADRALRVLPPIADDLLARPHPIHDDVADLIVRLAGNVCTGTPITGTNFVVTAAHCVLTKTGEVTQRTVVRDHRWYPAVAVLVDTEYLEHPTAEHDAAVLILAEQIPGPSARVGTSLPDIGKLTLAGFQPIDSDGTLLRGKDVHSHPRPKGASGTTINLHYEPAACVTAASVLDVSAARVMVPCGLVPGASGGGLYARDADGFVLVGILSSVTSDLKSNGVVPLDSLLELLAHPDQYAHGFSSDSNRIDRIELS